jgi:hypothetical protein
MNLTLSIFDLFAYAIPGSLYLSVLAYVLNRTGWLDFSATSNLNTTVLLVTAAIASYLAGHITYELGRALNFRLPRWEGAMSSIRETFLARVPPEPGRVIVQAHPSILLAAAEIRAKEAAVEISRLRAGGLMLQNSVPALLLAFVIALFEAIAGNRKLFAVYCSVLLLLAVFAAIFHGRRLQQWTISKTWEIAYWVVSIEELVVSPAPSGTRPTHSTSAVQSCSTSVRDAQVDPGSTGWWHALIHRRRR